MITWEGDADDNASMVIAALEVTVNSSEVPFAPAGRRPQLSCPLADKNWDKARTLALAKPAGGTAERPVVYLWEITSGKLLRTLRGHTAAVLGLRFTPDGYGLRSLGGDRHRYNGTFFLCHGWLLSSRLEFADSRGATSRLVIPWSGTPAGVGRWHHWQLEPLTQLATLEPLDHAFQGVLTACDQEERLLRGEYCYKANRLVQAWPTECPDITCIASQGSAIARALSAIAIGTAQGTLAL